MGTDSSYVGMPGFTKSNTNVGTGVNLQSADPGNPNGDVVDNSAGANPFNQTTLKNNPADARGAYRRRYSSTSALYPSS